MTEFHKRFEQLKQEYENNHAFEVAHTFLAFCLEWAAQLEKSDPRDAIEKYKCAEDCQATIGTFATGSGEGLASMAALYEIMGKRAAVVEKLANSAADPATARQYLNDALAIWSRIHADPNGLGEDTPAAQMISQLKAKLQQLK